MSAQRDRRSFDPNEIRLTDNAVFKVRALVEDEGNPSLKLRVISHGRGLLGLSMALTKPSVKTT